MFHWFLTAFLVVLSAELAGDKLLYTTAALTRRYPRLPLATGLMCGFVLKMALAVAFGRAFLSLPRPLLIVATSATFIAMIARLCAVHRDRPPASGSGGSEASAVAFASVVFGEWGDPGQLAAAGLVIESRAPFVIWFAAVLAMMTKGTIALTIGAGLFRRLSERVPERLMRFAMIGLFATAGVLAVAEMIAR